MEASECERRGTIMLTARAHVLSTLLYQRTLNFRGQASLNAACAGPCNAIATSSRMRWRIVVVQPDAGSAEPAE
jgi:hypothetical protein